MERESILSVYSALYTYDADSEKNNSILKKRCPDVQKPGTDAVQYAGQHAAVV